MTADDLMRLIGRYVEACDYLGDGLFEKPLTTTDALHAKACGLHGQILAEVYRLHAEAGEAHRLLESERALVATLRDEMDEGLRLRELGGARPDEGITAMTERIVAENAQLREAVRSARADEAHCWASRVDGLTAQLREVDARYMVLLKAVADGVAMQPKTVVLGLAPNVRANRETPHDDA